MGRLRKHLLACIAVAAVAPAAASAATVGLKQVGTRAEGHGATVRVFDLQFQAAPGETNDVTATPLGGYPGAYRFADAGAALSPGDGCRTDGASVVCSAPDQQSSVGTASIDLGDGNDRFHLEGPGVSGAGFPRTMLNAGAGDDDLTIDGSQVVVDGGPGADRVRATKAYVSLTYAERTADVSVTPDGQPNDGQSGEHDDILGVTELVGGAGNDTLVAGERSSRLVGNAGNDRLVGSDDTALSGASDLIGPHADGLYGGPGDDVLDGRGGDDLLDGGPGRDDLHGGTGKDEAVEGAKGAPVAVTLDDQPNDGATSEGDDVHTDVEDVSALGSPARLVGDAADNVLTTGGGGVVLGRGGADRLISYGSVSFGFNPPAVLDGGAGSDWTYSTVAGDRVRMNDGEADQLICDGFGPASVFADARDSLSPRFGACDLILSFRGDPSLRMRRDGGIPVRLTCGTRSGPCDATLGVRLAMKGLPRLALGSGRATLVHGRTMRLAVSTTPALRRVVTRRRRVHVAVLAKLDHGGGHATTSVAEYELLAPGR